MRVVGHWARSQNFAIMNITKIPKAIVLSLVLMGSIFSQAEKNRLIILADMGNKPDEEQQMIHIILEVYDVKTIERMTDYGRVILHME